MDIAFGVCTVMWDVMPYNLTMLYTFYPCGVFHDQYENHRKLPFGIFRILKVINE